MQLLFTLKPILLTEVTVEGKKIATISYPFVRRTKDMQGTDSGKAGIYKGKITKDSEHIQIGEKSFSITRKLLTEHDIFTLRNSYHLYIKNNESTVFECEEVYTSWKAWPAVSFVKEDKKYTLKNIPFRTRTWTLSCDSKICGTFKSQKHFSIDRVITYTGDESLDISEIIFLYSIVLRPGR